MRMKTNGFCFLNHAKKWLVSLGLLLTAASCENQLDVPPGTAGPDGVPAVNLSNARRGGGVPAIFAGAIAFDLTEQTITLPLYKGKDKNGGDTYFILTETSDFNLAVQYGINWAPKLAKALGSKAVQQATPQGVNNNANPRAFLNRSSRNEAIIQFTGGVDFRPSLNLIPGPEGFPLDPATAPGSVGDANYSPLFTIDNQIVFNAPHMANATGLHDDVLSIDYQAMQVKLRLVAGFYEKAKVLYLSTEASVKDIAALESGTYTPNLAFAPTVGDRDPATSSREAIIPIINGAMGENNPERQGLRSAVAGEGNALNIFREEQECGDPRECSAIFYSPLWDVHPVAWTQDAIDAGKRRRLTTHVEVIELFRQGYLVSPVPEGVNVNPKLGDLRAAGIVINCPNMFVEDTGEEDEDEQ